MKTHKELLKFCLELIKKEYSSSKPVEKGMHPIFYRTLSYEGDVVFLKEIEQLVQVLPEIIEFLPSEFKTNTTQKNPTTQNKKDSNELTSEEIDSMALTYWQNELANEEIDSMALAYWQDDLAKFFYKQKEPSYVEYKMFYEGYRAGLKKTNE
jgi:hypothetical protein